MHHVLLDRWSRGSSAMHRLDPRAKIIVLLVLLVALATARRELFWLSLAFAGLLVAGLLRARVPLAGALRRAALVLPFAAVFGGVAWLAGDPAKGSSLAVKSYLSALAVVFVVSTTPLPSLLRGFESLGAPRFLLQVAQFLYRYLFVISEEAQHMAKAAAARGATARRWAGGGRRFQAAAGALGVLFARSYGRAESVHRAMLARGFQGNLPLLATSRFGVRDALFTAVASSVIVAVRLATGGMVR